MLIMHYFLRKQVPNKSKKACQTLWKSVTSISLVNFFYIFFRVNTPEKFEKIHVIVLSDHRFTVSQIGEAIGISVVSVTSILNEHLGVRNLSARWVQWLLTNDSHVTTQNECVEVFNRNSNYLRYRFMNVDETWIHIT